MTVPQAFQGSESPKPRSKPKFVRRIAVFLMAGAIAVIFIGLLVPAIEKTREAASRMQSLNNLKNVALGIHTYHDTNKRFPTPAGNRWHRPLEPDQSGFSWRVGIDPYLVSRMELSFQQHMKWDEPWDSTANLQHLDRMVWCFENCSRSKLPAGHTYFQFITGPGTLFDGDRKRSLGSIKDGASKTLLIVDAADAVPFTKPQDVAIADLDQPLPRFGDPARPDRLFIALVDGNALVLVRPTEELIRALITPDGGEPVDLEP